MKHTLLQELAKLYNVKLVIEPQENNPYASGVCVLEKQSVVVYDSNDYHDMVCTLLHEIGHIHCLRNGLFPEYHNPRSWKTPHKLKSTAWWAENYTDCWAETEFNRIFPDGIKGVTFRQSYRDEASKIELEMFLDSWQRQA